MLKKHITLLLLLLLTSLIACDKQPIDSDIEGHWKLEEFTLTEANQNIPCERLFWSITRVNVQLMEKQGKHGYAVLDALLVYRDNRTTLVLKDIKLADGKTDATIEQIRPYGLYSLQENIFYVERLTHKEMILKSDFATLRFRKF